MENVKHFKASEYKPLAVDDFEATYGKLTQRTLIKAHCLCCCCTPTTKAHECKCKACPLYQINKMIWKNTKAGKNKLVNDLTKEFNTENVKHFKASEYNITYVSDFEDTYGKLTQRTLIKAYCTRCSGKPGECNHKYCPLYQINKKIWKNTKRD